MGPHIHLLHKLRPLCYKRSSRINFTKGIDVNTCGGQSQGSEVTHAIALTFHEPGGSAVLTLPDPSTEQRAGLDLFLLPHLVGLWYGKEIEEKITVASLKIAHALLSHILNESLLRQPTQKPER